MRAQDAGRRTRRAVAAVAAALMAVCGGGCAIAGRMSGVSDARALHEAGKPAEATILEIWDTGMTVNDDPVAGFLLEVRPAGGDAYRARTKLRIPRLAVPQFQPGRVVPVRIDPRDAAHVALDIYEFDK